MVSNVQYKPVLPSHSSVPHRQGDVLGEERSVLAQGETVRHAFSDS